MEEGSRKSSLLLGAFRKVPTARCLLPTAFRLLLTAFCLLLAAYCLLPSVLYGQGCAMCYTSASAARSTAKAALANGTLILLVPPMVFFALITVVVYKYRDKFRETPIVRGTELPVAESRWPIERVANRPSSIVNRQSSGHHGPRAEDRLFQRAR
jgi:hypothetical protein